ncbi:MAG: hypothetical protein ACI33J_12360 [Clostridium sp.]
MIKLSLFYFKKTIKSPLLIIALVINIFLTTKIIGVLDTSLFKFTQVYYYAIICTNLFMLISTASIMSKNYEVLSFLERDKWRKVIVTLLSSIYITLALSILPIGTMLIFNNSVTDMYFIKNAILHFLVIWMLSNILAAVIGSTAGLIIQNGFASVIAIVAYSLFLWESQKITKGIFHRYINIFDDHTFVEYNNLSGPIFNNAYIMDKIFLILLIIFILLVAYSFYSYSKKLIYISLACITLSALIFMVYQGEKRQIIAKPQIFNNNDTSYNIKSYKMDLYLNKTLKNITNLTLQFNEDTTEIDLVLDDIFTLNELKIDKKSIDFQRKDDTLKIRSSFKKNQIIQLVIAYEGKINVENELGVNMYYVHDKTVNLPGDTFAWYPKPISSEQNKSIKFEVEIQSPALIFSNIDSKKEISKFLSGRATSLNLFAGNYKSIKQNNIQYIIPTSYDIDMFKESLNNTINILLGDHSNSFSESEKEMLKKKSYQKVLVGAWPYNTYYGDLELVGDTLLVKYIDY